jgi:transcriptional regulator GlxA family with amidase domain
MILREAASLDSRIQTTIALLQGGIASRVDVDELARKANISTSHLRHLFKLETGLTLMQYLKLIRMQKAEQLLLSTFLSVKEIMNRVGISNESYFSREFKRTFGLAPLQYRNSVERRSKKQAR